MGPFGVREVALPRGRGDIVRRLAVVGGLSLLEVACGGSPRSSSSGTDSATSSTSGALSMSSGTATSTDSESSVDGTTTESSDSGRPSETTDSPGTSEESTGSPPAPSAEVRAVLNVVRNQTLGGEPASSLLSGDFRNWTVVEQSNASITVAPDNASVRLVRDEGADQAPARAVLEFTVGQLYADADVSVCVAVTEYSEADAGRRGGGLAVLGSHVVGATTRTPTEDGVWCTVLQVTRDTEETTIQIGLGVTAADTRTRAMTLSNFSVSPVFDGLPNEFVPAATRWSGTSFNHAKSVDYDPQTGLTVFDAITRPDTGASPASVLAITDSFGGFISIGVWELVYGFDTLGQTPRYAVRMNSVAGRSLFDTNPQTDPLLDELVAAVVDRDPSDAAPGICWIAQGVNDFVVEARDAPDVFADLQAHAQWCFDNEMHAVLVTAGPFRGFQADGQEVWTPGLEDERLAYNDLVRTFVDEDSEHRSLVDYDQLLDGDADGVLDAEFSLDDLHPNGPGMTRLAVAADQEFRAVIQAASED